ncbi:hypothetical protein FKW77_000080 [Venturia effusa]|uniref:ubiquitinyl hydrolase 1 n=1 Tax=Venturia effusa TaxID=50376 RepID=A0A517LLZ7_9PEZI|nr:hypothetical protein FKW77_000080 [Venturia effusa]
MVPLPFEKLVALLALEKQVSQEKRGKPRKTVRNRSFAQSPLQPQRSNGIRKDMPRTTPPALSGSGKIVSAQRETPATDTKSSCQDRLKMSQINSKPDILVPLKNLRVSEPKPVSKSGNMIEKPAISFEASVAPTISKKNDRIWSSRDDHHKEQIDMLESLDKKTKPRPEGLLENEADSSQQRRTTRIITATDGQFCKLWHAKTLFSGNVLANTDQLHLPAFLHVLQLHGKNSTVLCDPQDCTCVACGLRNLATTYWSSASHVSVTNAVTAFDSLVNRRAPKSGTKFMYTNSRWFGRGWRFEDQMDAQEWCLFLIDQMIDPQIRKNPTLPSKRALEKSDIQFDPTNFGAKMRDIFELSYSQTMTCGACRVSRKFHGLQKILGPVPLASSSAGQKSISFCLSQFFSSDFWEVKCENKRCPKFNKPGIKNRVAQSIVTAPEVLMIQLKCFMSSGKRTGKKNPKLDFGHDLDLSNYASPELLEQERELRYKLCSVIIHQGSSLEMGHYVGVYTSPNGQVHHISDECVSRCSSDALTSVNQKGTPYILCYTRMRAEEPEAQSLNTENAQRRSFTDIKHVRPASKPQRSKDTSKVTAGCLTNRGMCEHDPIASEELQDLGNGLASKSLPKINGVTSPKSSTMPPQKLLRGQSTPSVSSGPFTLPGVRPATAPKDSKSSIVGIQDLAGMRAKPPNSSQQLSDKLLGRQSLSKNKVRKMKKKQMRLQVKE